MSLLISFKMITQIFISHINVALVQSAGQQDPITVLRQSQFSVYKLFKEVRIDLTFIDPTPIHQIGPHSVPLIRDTRVSCVDLISDVVRYDLRAVPQLFNIILGEADPPVYVI